MPTGMGTTTGLSSAILEDKRRETKIKSRIETRRDVVKRIVHQISHSPHIGLAVRQHARQGSHREARPGETLKANNCTRLTRTMTCNAGVSSPSLMDPSPLVLSTKPSSQPQTAEDEGGWINASVEALGDLQAAVSRDSEPLKRNLCVSLTRCIKQFALYFQ